MPTARWCCAPRSTWPRPTSTCATRRCTASSAPRTTTPATAGASTRCTPTRTRWKTRWRTSPTASARWSSRTSAPSTTGCWSAWPNCGLLAQPLPKQYEFARLNLTYIVTSKRKLRQLVEEGIVEGWDDPRMPTLVGMRRRGYTPESLRLLAERSGVSKAGGWIDYSSLDIALREDLDTKAPRAMAVLDPLKLVLTNWDQVIGKGQTLPCSAPLHPGQPERGHAPLHARPRGLDRARGLHGRAAEGLPPPEPAALRRQGRADRRQRGAAEVRLHHPVHRA